MSYSIPMSNPLSLPLQVDQYQILRGLVEQQAFGASFAEVLAFGSVLFLQGELGAGKTSFSQGLVDALGFDDVVTSPTYALMNVYPTRSGQVLHVDAYRVQDVGELYEMDLEELISNSRLTLVEWGEKLYEDYSGAPILLLEHIEDQPDIRKATRIQ